MTLLPPNAEHIAARRKRRLGYLSAAPTVSTAEDAISAGPRAHILGVIQGFEAAGFDVERFIAGDRMAPALGKSRVQALLESSKLARYAGDLVRLTLAKRNAARSFAELGGRVDWVYERFATMQVIGRRFQHAGIPWILETQGLFYYETRAERQNVGWHGLAKSVEIAAYRDCDVLVCISQPLKTLLVEQCGVDPGKILIVPNAVDPNRFDGNDDALGPACDRNLTLVFVGGLIQWQALDILLTALADLRREDIRIDLRVVGTGAMEKPWQQLTSELHLDDQVTFRGHVAADRVAEEIKAADIGYAGAKVMAIGAMYHSPIKLYEYMAASRPVIAAAHDDAISLIDGYDTGFLFQPENPEDLKEKLRQAHAVHQRDHGATIRQMGSNARTLIDQQHSWTARTASMITQIEHLLERKTDTTFNNHQPARIPAE